jgi:hypothetical protein
VLALLLTWRPSFGALFNAPFTWPAASVDSRPMSPRGTKQKPIIYKIMSRPLSVSPDDIRTKLRLRDQLRAMTRAPTRNAGLAIRRPIGRHWRSEIADRKKEMSALPPKQTCAVQLGMSDLMSSLAERNG